MLLSICIGLLILFISAIIRYYRFVRRYPKGPTPLPFIGNTLDQNISAPHESYERLSQGFGGLCTIFYSSPVIHISDYALIREAFIEKGDDFADRPHTKMMDAIRSCEGDKGVLGSNGDVWREQRRTSISILKDFGIGRNLQEQLVNSSVTECLEHLDGIEDKQNVNMRWPIQVMIANIINELLFGFRFEYDNCDTLIQYVEELNSIGRAFGGSKLLWLGFYYFPFLTKLPWIGYHILHKHIERAKHLDQYISDCFTRAMESYKEDEEPKCFVHAYKQRMIKNAKLDVANLMTCCADFFFAGQETTTTTLRWAMLILIKHSQVQEKLRAEILEVVGRDRLPSLGDQPQMLYTRAVIHEIQRVANIVPTNVMRTTSRDTVVGGHFIPRGTNVNADIHYVMAHDPVFENPEEFRPERYLTEDGKALRKDLIDRTLPFSLGKRVCTGESLARAELFLCLTATLQRYRLSARPGETIDLTPVPHVIQLPKEQLVVLERVM